MGKKKGRKGDPGFDDDFNDTGEPPGPTGEQTAVAFIAKPGRAAKKGKKKATAADWGSEEDETELTVDLSAQIGSKPSQSAAKGSVKPNQAVDFSLLDEQDGNDGQLEEEVEGGDAQQPASRPTASPFDILQADEGTADSEAGASDSEDTQVCIHSMSSEGNFAP